MAVGVGGGRFRVGDGQKREYDWRDGVGVSVTLAVVAVMGVVFDIIVVAVIGVCLIYTPVAIVAIAVFAIIVIVTVAHAANINVVR